MSDRAETRARLHSPGDWATYGSQDAHDRYAKLMPGKSSHTGMANGVALCSGCELSIRRWVRDPYWDRRTGDAS